MRTKSRSGKSRNICRHSLTRFVMGLPLELKLVLMRAAKPVHFFTASSNACIHGSSACPTDWCLAVPSRCARAGNRKRMSSFTSGAIVLSEVTWCHNRNIPRRSQFHSYGMVIKNQSTDEGLAWRHSLSHPIMRSGHKLFFCQCH